MDSITPEHAPKLGSSINGDEKREDVTTIHAVQDDGSAPQENDLHRGLKNRHIQMIALGGVIGTGLFLGSAPALATGGPLGLILGYSVIGSLVFSMMACLGEMITHTPIAGGHISLGGRYVGDSMSFTLGWFYWYLWAISLPAELSACAVLVGYWLPDVNPGAWIGLVLVICLALNCFHVRVYGESEFWFASLKIILIIGLIIGGIIVSAGGNPRGETIGFKYWSHPNGPFRQFQGIGGSTGRFLAFWSTLTRAAFSYVGLENCAMAAGEARGPKQAMPKAIKRVWIRIVVFFLLSVFVTTLLVPSSEPRLLLGSGTAASSAFVIAFQRVGITGLPSVINAGILSSACSASSAHMYLGSRALWAMATQGRAPRIFQKTNKNGIPYYAVAVSFAFGLLGFTSAGAATAAKIFNYFANMISVVGLLSWCGIAFVYIRFKKACDVQGLDRSTLVYKSVLQPGLAWYTLIFCAVIVLFNTWTVFRPGHWSNADFICGYLPIPLFFIAYFGHKFITKSSMIPPEDVDLVTGSDEASYGPPLPTPTTKMGKFVAAII